MCRAPRCHEACDADTLDPGPVSPPEPPGSPAHTYRPGKTQTGVRTGLCLYCWRRNAPEQETPSGARRGLGPKRGDLGPGPSWPCWWGRRGWHHLSPEGPRIPGPEMDMGLSCDSWGTCWTLASPHPQLGLGVQDGPSSGERPPPPRSGGVSVTGARFRGLHLGPQPNPEGAGGGQHASEARTQETTSPKATPREWARGRRLCSRQERPQLPAIPAGGPQGLMGEPGRHQDPHPVHVPRMWGRGVTLPPGRRQELT